MTNQTIETNILSNFRLRLVQLTSMNVNTTTQTSDASELIREDKARILEIRDDVVRIGFTMRLLFKPEGTFNITVDFMLLYKIKEPISEDIIKANYPDLVYPAVARASLLIGILTDQMGYNPIIPPPVFEETSATEVNN